MSAMDLETWNLELRNYDQNLINRAALPTTDNTLIVVTNHTQQEDIVLMVGVAYSLYLPQVVAH